MGLEQFMDASDTKVAVSSLATILDEVRSTSKSKEKIEILKRNADNKELQRILFYCYNTFVIYNLKQVPSAQHGSLLVEKEITSLIELLNNLYNRVVTGNAAKDMVKNYLSMFTEDSQDIITKIIKKDLKLGCSVSTVNKVWPDLIPTFDIALAKPYEGKQDIFNGQYLTSRKLDGIRCVTVIREGLIKFYTRKGKEFQTLNVLLESVKNLGINNGVLDGECCIVDENGLEDFPAIMKQWNKKDFTIKNPKYLIFDFLTLEEFDSKTSIRTFDERYTELKTTIKDTKTIEVLEQLYLTEENFNKMQETVQEKGWEGLIVRKADVPYKGKRSTDILKIKTFFEDDFKVVDIKMEDISYAKKGEGQVHEMMMKSVSILYKKKYPVDVGSGWTRKQRQEYYKDPKKIIGKIITIQHFGQSEDSKTGKPSLRFPTLKIVHGDKREV